MTEYVTNGTFDTDIVGWTDNSTGGGVIEWVSDYGGSIYLYFTGIARADQQLAATVAGVQYQVTFDVAAGGGSLPAAVEIGTTEGDSDLLSVSFGAPGSFSGSFVAAGASTWIGLYYDPSESYPYVYLDNVSVQESFGGGFWQSEKGIARRSDPTLKMGDVAYRELIRAKANANNVDPLLANIYTYIVNAHERITDVTLEDPTSAAPTEAGIVDITIREDELMYQGERYRIQEHSPRRYGVHHNVANWTFEYLPFTQYLNSVPDWSINDATIDGYTAKILTADTADHCWLPRAHFVDVSAANFAYGTWEWWISKDAAGAPVVMPIASAAVTPTNATQDGYSVAIGATGILSLNEVTNGAPTPLFATAAAAVADDTWTKITVTRSAAHSFSVYIDGVLAVADSGDNPVVDATNTTSGYMVLDLDAGDQVGLERFQDDIKLFTYEPL